MSRLAARVRGRASARALLYSSRTEERRMFSFSGRGNLEEDFGLLALLGAIVTVDDWLALYCTDTMAE